MTTNWKKHLAAIVFAALFALTAQAQKFAYVDTNKILESVSDYRKAQDELDKLASKWRQDIAQEYDKIKGMYNRYQAEQVLLSDEVKKQREEEIMNKEKEVREMQKDKFGAEGALFKKRQELVRPIQDKVYAAIENYAAEKGYDFIFDRSDAAVGIIYSNASFDKTSDVVKRIGK